MWYLLRSLSAESTFTFCHPSDRSVSGVGITSFRKGSRDTEYPKISAAPCLPRHPTYLRAEHNITCKNGVQPWGGLRMGGIMWQIMWLSRITIHVLPKHKLPEVFLLRWEEVVEIDGNASIHLLTSLPPAVCSSLTRKIARGV